MIRRTTVLFLLALAGCSGLKDAFTGHQDVVARVGSQELTAEMLANTVAPAKRIPLERDVLARIAELWVDYQLMGQAVGGGDSLLDSVTVYAANWPVIAQRLANRLHDTLIVSRSRVSGVQVDSAYNAGNELYIYHLLVATRGPDTTTSSRAARRRQAEGYLAQIRRGTPLPRLAAQVSDDPGSKPQGGLLGMVPRGMTVRPFEDAAFALRPGQTSGVVETAFGYHIIWRPALAEVRDSFAEAVREIAINRLDSAYLDSLSNRTGIRVRGSAPARVRAAATNLTAAKEGSRVLATYRGGRLRERDFARWLQAFAPQVRGQITQAPDSVLTEFVKSIARNDMLMKAATEMRIQLAPGDWDSIRANYRREIEYLAAALTLAPESLAADTAAAGAARGEVAAQHINAYFQAITSPNSARPYVEVPPYLADVLRERYRWNVSQAGIDRALERARVIRGPETPMAPSMEPAPSGPPVGGTAPGDAAPRPAPARPRS